MAQIFTAERRQQAQEILDQFDEQLHRQRAINTVALEFELRRAWDVGYQTIKSIIIDIMQNHPQYEHLAAYYAEYSNHMMAMKLDAPFFDEDARKMCVISEFKQPLAELYGASSWHHDDTLAGKRRAYWHDAFSLSLPQSGAVQV